MLLVKEKINCVINGCRYIRDIYSKSIERPFFFDYTSCKILAIVSMFSCGIITTPDLAIEK